MSISWMFYDSIDKSHPPMPMIRQTDMYKQRVLPVKKRNTIYSKRGQEYVDLIEKSSQNVLNRHSYEISRIKKDLTRIKYEKKHKDLFKRFHTREGLELANKEAFDNLMKIDTRGEYWEGFIL